jgi:L-fuconolactonase
MPQAADAKGDYRGTTVRGDIALNAWLARHPTEAPLEPDLPIVDPHHHFWDSPHRGHYLLP